MATFLFNLQCFGQWQGRYIDEKTSDESNCENKLPCNEDRRQSNRQESHRQKQQVQTNNAAAITVTPDKAKQSPSKRTVDFTRYPVISCLSMRQSAIESFPGPSGHPLTDYIVGELEPLPKGFDPSTVKDKVNENQDIPYTYITFNKPNKEGRHFWRPIKDPQSPQKKKHCSTPVRSSTDRTDKHQKTGGELTRANKRIYLPKKG